MSSVLRTTKEATSLRRQFTVYPYFAGGTNQFFTASNNTLYRFHADLSGVEYVVARDMGTEMEITAIDPNIINLLELQDTPGTPPVQIIRNGRARKFQILSMVSGNINGGTTGYGNDPAYTASNDVFDITGASFNINDALIVGDANTTNPTTDTQTLPFGTFWAVNEPIIVQYTFSSSPRQRAIKNRIDETTLF